MSSSTSISADASSSCLAYRSARGTPLVICAATAEPTDVPTIRSAEITRPARSGSASCRPRSTPSSHAMPATPPPARTRARFTRSC